MPAQDRALFLTILRGNDEKEKIFYPVADAKGCTIYQHNKGVIQDNAIQALLSDKLFRQRIEKNEKVKVAINVTKNIEEKFLKSPIIKFLIIKVL